MPGVQKTGAKNRKFGRNAAFCLRYFNENRRSRNKEKKLKRRIRRNKAEMARKARRDPPYIVKLDTGAIDALKALR